MSLKESASRIRLLVLDIDGTMTDGSIVIAAQGEAAKTFNVRDGLGIKLLMRNGIKVGIITGRRSAIVTARMRELGVPYVYQGQADKRQALRSILESAKLDESQTAYMGDDLPDLAVMKLCGLSAAPADACGAVLERAMWVSRFAGGHGAVRELAELLLKAHGLWDRIVAEDFGG